MIDVKEPYYVTLIDGISHQNIGGKTLRVEKEGTMAYIINTFSKDFTIAMYNFVLRRDDIFAVDKNMPIYYGHIDNLGYFIAADEIKEVLKDEEN